MTLGLPEDTEITHCWFCRKYHSADDRQAWCFRLSRFFSYIFDNWFEWYLKAAMAAIVAAVIWLAVTELFGR